MLVKDFIQGPLIKEIEDMTMRDGKPIHAYLGFQLISSSIEFLGSCLDSYDWAEKGLSEKRFRLAIDKLFPVKYKKYNNKKKFDLYSNLRCSLVHSSRPGNFIGLLERKHGCNGLLEEDKMLKICFEDFLSDFKNACNKLINFIDNRSISGEKVYCHIISIPQD